MICGALIVATFALFYLFPGLDPATSALFYDGSRFPISSDPVVEFLRNSLWNLALAAFGLCVVGMIAAIVRGRPILGIAPKIWAFFVALFVTGPGLVVNVLLKSNWGRARPVQTDLFGGEALFTPPWQITDQCARNCSFVSGEVSGATALAIVLAVALWTLRQRMPAKVVMGLMLVSVALPLFATWQRVAAGGHFLSDCLFAILFNSAIALILFRVIVQRRSAATALADKASRLGRDPWQG